MSLIRRCDICGRELDTTDVYYVVEENVPLLEIKRDIDVCKRCMERLIEEVKDDKALDTNTMQEEENMELIEPAIYTAYFHGELWYKCPHCGFSFEYHDAVFEREGIKKTNENEVYVCSCGKKFQIK